MKTPNPDIAVTSNVLQQGTQLRVGIPRKIAEAFAITPGDQIIWTVREGKLIANLRQRGEDVGAC